MVTPASLLLNQKLARARSLLRRDEAVRGIDELIAGIESYAPKQLPGKVRFDIEVLLQECVNELNRQPHVRDLFKSLTKNSKARVPYSPGQEDKLMPILLLVQKALKNAQLAQQQATEAEQAKRRNDLEQKGLEYLKNGDFSRGKSALRILAEEYGQEPKLLARIGEWLIQYKLYFEAAELLEKAITRFPKDNNAYTLVIECYQAMRDREKIESTYIRAIKEFGRHPYTLLNLARLYQKWNRKEEAFHLAQEAWDKDPSLEEAKAIVEENS